MRNVAGQWVMRQTQVREGVRNMVRWQGSDEECSGAMSDAMNAGQGRREECGEATREQWGMWWGNKGAMRNTAGWWVMQGVIWWMWVREGMRNMVRWQGDKWVMRNNDLYKVQDQMSAWIEVAMKKKQMHGGSMRVNTTCVQRISARAPAVPCKEIKGCCSLTVYTLRLNNCSPVLLARGWGGAYTLLGDHQ